ncbi:MAG: hypothetical protein EZS28_042490, partial [Streblomastix strix]
MLVPDFQPIVTENQLKYALAKKDLDKAEADRRVLTARFNEGRIRPKAALLEIKLAEADLLLDKYEMKFRTPPYSRQTQLVDHSNYISPGQYTQTYNDQFQVQNNPSSAIQRASPNIKSAQFGPTLSPVVEKLIKDFINTTQAPSPLYESQMAEQQYVETIQPNRVSQPLSLSSTFSQHQTPGTNRYQITPYASPGSQALQTRFSENSMIKIGYDPPSREITADYLHQFVEESPYKRLHDQRMKRREKEKQILDQMNTRSKEREILKEKELKQQQVLIQQQEKQILSQFPQHISNNNNNYISDSVSRTPTSQQKVASSVLPLF